MITKHNSNHMMTLESILIFLCFRREEVSGEAQRVLRTFPAKSLEKEDSKPMPSFPDMVAYVQEKVSPCACHCSGGSSFISQHDDLFLKVLMF